MKPSVTQQWIAALQGESERAPLVDARTYRHYVEIPRWWKSVYDLRQLAPGDRILEIGSGSGDQLLPLAAQGYAVTGLDVSLDAL